MPRPRRAPVAGLDVGATRLEVADRVVCTLVTAVRAHGIETRALQVGIHRILHDGASAGSHLAVSMSVDEADVDDLWELSAVVADALRLPGPTSGIDADHAGVVVGARRGGDRALACTAAAAATEQADRTGGRAVHFGGAARLRGAMSVTEVLAVSSVDSVVDLTDDREPRPDDVVLLSGAVRPRWQFGLLVLHVVAAPGTDSGVYLPFDLLNRAAMSPSVG